jgi:uncharacterized repeat protein (TIGR01451 family)
MRCGLAMLLALVTTGFYASTAQAAPRDTVRFSCSSVTYSFTGFPNAPNNVIAEKIILDGAQVYKGTFTFNGPSGTTTVNINVAPGRHTMIADASDHSNGVSFEKDIKARKGITCPVSRPAFTIDKLQKIFGSPEPFTKSELGGEVGQTVDYEIIVKNTGNTSLKVDKLSDATCENIAPSGEVTLAPGGEQTYTCEHMLNLTDAISGSYENNATAMGAPPPGQGSPITHMSNTVITRIQKPAEPSFTIEKLQEVAGSGKGFTTSELTGKIGQTVDYEIIVKNTGNTSLKFSKLTDANCEGISPSGEAELAAGGEQTYTCTHKLTATGKYGNKGSITGNEGTGEKTSNEVVVSVPKDPSFTIEKLQEIAGSGKGLTTSELTGKIGQTVDYEIIIKNTGNASLKFSKLTDPNCEGISPSGETELGAGAEETFTCTHKLTATGKYGNKGSITGNEGTGEKTSNEVVVNVPKEPSFTIEKLQEIAGSGKGFTTSELTGKISQTVDYEIIVKNTGNTSLKFSKLTDANCEGISPSGETELVAGAEETFTCEHKLTAVGSYTNEASIAGNEGTGTRASNTVVVNVVKISFSIEKEQKIEGEPSFTTVELTGKVGQTVDYQIVVKNTGSVPLTFSNFIDEQCDEGTISGGPGASAVAPGAATTYTCSLVLRAFAGVYTNGATVTGTPPTGEGSPITSTSNTVEVNVPSNEGKGGNFVIGDKNNVIGNAVTFWSSQWATENSLSGGPAPNSFKGFNDEGFEDEPAPAACGHTWTTDPGNSSMPPAGPLPTYLYVIVSDLITKSGMAIQGDTVHVVLVKTNPGYEPNPGHHGTGTVVRTIC